MSVSHVASFESARRGGVRWTTENPPDKIVDFVQWWVRERRYGEGARDYALVSTYTDQTISNWLKDPRVLVLLEAEMQGTTAGPLRVLDVLNMLHRRAVEEDDVKAAGLYLNAVGRMAPRRTEVDVRITDTRQLTNEQLRAQLARAMQLLGEPEVIEAEVVSDSLDVGALDPYPGPSVDSPREDTDGRAQEREGPSAEG